MKKLKGLRKRWYMFRDLIGLHSKKYNYKNNYTFEDIAKENNTQKNYKQFNSGEYWENRYKANGNSGAGSYNRLAEFKAEVINGFVKENNMEINYHFLILKITLVLMYQKQF